ncbi:MAG: site-specific tyrosine recombinase XerD [Dehalococcoidia bacterium]
MKETVNAFLHHLVAERGFSPNTLQAYRNDLYQFIEFMERHPTASQDSLGWAQVELPLLTEYVLSLEARQYSPATKARKVAALKSLFGFLVEEGTMENNPTEGLSAPRVGRSLPKFLAEEEVEHLLAQPDREHTPEAQRDKAMLELLYATGMRVSELVNIDVQDVRLDEREPWIRCLGKGSKERDIPLHHRAARVLRYYIASVRPRLASNHERALFVNRRGERITRQGFWLRLKSYAKQANINKPITPHIIRHSFATHMLRGGASLRNVQAYLGHASVTSTQVYTHLTDDHLREAYDQSHPRA